MIDTKMIVTKKHLQRRTFLRGLGTTLALPFLDAMVPAFAAPKLGATKPVVRMGFVYVPNGIISAGWSPLGEGANFEFNSTMKPLAPFRENTLVLSGLAQIQGRSYETAPAIMPGQAPLGSPAFIRKRPRAPTYAPESPRIKWLPVSLDR